MQLTIPQGATLSGIAQQKGTTVRELMRLNPQIQDPNIIKAGAFLNLPETLSPTPTDPTGVIVSSEGPRNQFNQDVASLQKTEGQFVVQPTGLDGKPPKEGTVPPPKPEGAITIKSDNPAFQSIIDQTNEMIRKAKESGTALPPSINTLIQQIQDFGMSKTSAIADARTAADAKDAQTLNDALTKSKEAEASQKSALNTLLEELKTARVGITEVLAPTAKETELQKNLITLRSERQLMPLELRKEGISAAGIAGRQFEDERVRSIQEQNLLLELGLEQEARKMKGEAATAQAGFIKDDITLRTQIQKLLDDEEKNVLEQARNLRNDGIKALGDIVDSFKGLAFTDMDADTQSQLLDTAKQFGITPDLLASALANAKKQQIFENAVKADKAGGISGGGVSGVAIRDADSVMSGTLNLQDISVKDNYRASVAAELTKRFNEAKKTGDVEGMMKASAVYDKEPGDTFLTSMEKTMAVISQIGTLQESFSEDSVSGVDINGNRVSTPTGPIIGAFRSANPWDTKAQVIKAQLSAIVPNLARGVYGEVGVLTDNDIKQYSKTLPTLTSTESIRNAILYITVDQIRKNVEIKIKNQAAGQRDMSGYADVYRGVNQLAGEILATIPNTGTPSLSSVGVDKKDEDLFDSLTTEINKTIKSGGFFSNLWKGITGQ